MTTTTVIPTADEMKTLARGFVDIARQHDLARLVAELELNGTRVEVTIDRPLVEREQVEGAPEGLTAAVRDELVTVKAGARSRPKTLVAAPADWLMP